jgi:hypothetical protein
VRQYAKDEVAKMPSSQTPAPKPPKAAGKVSALDFINALREGGMSSLAGKP